MNIAIEPIQYGLNRQATSVEAIWAEIPFDAENYCIKLLLKDAETNLLDIVEIPISRTDYEALGDSEDSRVNVLIANAGMVRVEDMGI